MDKKPFDNSPRTSQSLANSMRTLRAYISAVQTQLGAGLGSAIRHVVVWLNTLMQYVLKAATAFATFMQTIFGKYKGGASGIAMEGFGDAAAYADDLGDAAGEAASGLGDAADAAKDLRKELSVLPFDELNQLNKDKEATTSGGGGGGAGAGGGGGLLDGLLDWGDMFNTEAGSLPDAISKWAKEIKRRFLEHDWVGLGRVVADGLNTGLQKLYDILDPEKIKAKVFPWIDAFTTTFNSFVKYFDWNLLGRTVGRGINDLVAIIDRTITGIDWKQLGSQFANGLNGMIDEIDWKALGTTIGDYFMISWNTLYGFVHKFDWANLGKQIGEGLNGLNDAINWSTVADAITTGFNGVFEALANFTKTVQWDDIAQNIIDGLNTAIHNTDWAANGEAIGNFIRNLCDTMIKIIDETDWIGFGEGLATALQKIPWGKILEVVGKVIVNVFGGILKGLASTPAGVFADALILGMLAFKWQGPITAVVRLIASHFSSQQAVALLGTTGTKLGSILGSSFVSGFAAPAALATAGVAAFVLSLRGIAREGDKLRGGNGVLTQMGAGFDELVGSMAEANVITDQQSDELFRLKENAENLGYSTEQTAGILMDALQGYGVSASTAKGFADDLINSGRGQVDVLKEASEVFSNYSDTIRVKSGEIDMSLVAADEGFRDLRDAMYQVYTSATDTSVPYEQILRDFDATQGSAKTAQEAYDQLRNIVETYGGSMEDVNNIMMDMTENGIPKYAEATQDMALALNGAETELLTTTQYTHEERRRQYAETADAIHESAVRNTEELQQELLATQEAAETQAQTLEDWQNNVQTYRDGVLKNLEEVGEGWGIVGSEQNQSLEALNANLEESINQQQTALENMRALNESGLDQATVQAIVAQIDPASAAMTDLIGHMQADDATWQEFHSNIQNSLDLKDDLGAVADGFAEEYAKAYAPEFVTIGEDFKVEGGKIGKFSVEGVAAGVYDNADQAISAMRDLATEMQNAYKETDQINSPSKVYEGFARNDVEGFIWGIQTGTPEVIREMQKFAKSVQDAVKDLPQTLRKCAEESASEFTSALSSGLSGVEGIVQNAAETIRSSMNIDLYAEGQSAAQSFANGFQGVHIPTPHMYVSNWDLLDMGDGGSMYIPSFSVQWYKAGGLFKGGKGNIIGIAENGNDEAVLPLENRQAMRAIGTAIADAGGNSGISNDLARDIASELAQVLLMNQDDRPINIYAELKTEDNEVLARAALKGLKSMDYRNNPTPQMSY